MRSYYRKRGPDHSETACGPKPDRFPTALAISSRIPTSRSADPGEHGPLPADAGAVDNAPPTAPAGRLTTPSKRWKSPRLHGNAGIDQRKADGRVAARSTSRTVADCRGDRNCEPPPAQMRGPARAAPGALECEARCRRVGWGTRIRTWTNGVRVRCSTVKLSPTGTRRRSEAIASVVCVARRM